MTNSPPALFPWPLLLFWITFLGGLTLDEIYGSMMINMFDSPLISAVGGALIIVSLMLQIWSIHTLVRHHTTIWPHRSATCLVVDGPYKYTRNPMYIAHMTFLLGLGLVFKSPFITLLTPLFSYAEQKISIEPEERHLFDKFGEDFTNYMVNTPRWL